MFDCKETAILLDKVHCPVHAALSAISKASAHNRKLAHYPQGALNLRPLPGDNGDHGPARLISALLPTVCVLKNRSEDDLAAEIPNDQGMLRGNYVADGGLRSNGLQRDRV